MFENNRNINKELLNIFEDFVADEKASDLHLRVDESPIFRTRNKLERINKHSIINAHKMEEYVKSLFFIRYPTEEIALQKYQDYKINGNQGEYDMAILIPNSSYRARVNIFKSMGKLGVVIRKIPNEMPNLENLGFNKEHYEKIREQASLKEGLILVTGQTGSGKSTTLAAIINDINKSQKKHIITIEDPVEFIHKNKQSIITHREVGEDADTPTFYSGLKAALREDPDIILVGEIRDEITALAAMQAAQTGHIVFATLHTNSAPETILRLIDMFPPEKEKSIKVSLATALRMIISQKLAPTIDNNKTLLYEILINNTMIQNLIISETFNDVQVASAMNSARNTEDKMLPLEYCILDRLKKGLITKETALEFANNKNNMKKIIQEQLGSNAIPGSSSSKIIDKNEITSKVPKGFF